MIVAVSGLRRLFLAIMAKAKTQGAGKYVRFTAVLQQFDEKAEKTAWTYLSVPKSVANQIKPGYRKSFRVKGKLDSHAISFIALMPMGEGEFILAVNAEMRKAIKKPRGARINVELTEDRQEKPFSADLLECLENEPAAKSYFNSLALSHRRYFSNWIEEAKMLSTKTRRLATVMEAFEKKLNYAEMMALYRTRI